MEAHRPMETTDRTETTKKLFRLCSQTITGLHLYEHPTQRFLISAA